MRATIKIKLPGHTNETEYYLVPDRTVSLWNQGPFNWVGQIMGIEVKVNNKERYSSLMHLASQLEPYRKNIEQGISEALRAWD